MKRILFVILALTFAAVAQQGPRAECDQDKDGKCDVCGKAVGQGGGQRRGGGEGMRRGQGPRDGSGPYCRRDNPPAEKPAK